MDVIVNAHELLPVLQNKNKWSYSLRLFCSQIRDIANGMHLVTIMQIVLNVQNVVAGEMHGKLPRKNQQPSATTP